MEGQNTQTQTLTRSTVKIAVIAWGIGALATMGIGYGVLTTTKPSSIMVLSPNGGESFNVGQTMTIRFMISGITVKSSPSPKISISAPVNSPYCYGYGYNKQCYYPTPSISPSISPSPTAPTVPVEIDLVWGPNAKKIDVMNAVVGYNEYSWVVLNKFPDAKKTDTYKISIMSKDGKMWDMSDKVFKIQGVIIATDSDNSPTNYPLTINKTNYPDLFIRGVARGTYVGSAPLNYIFGLEPELRGKLTTDNFSTIYDYCDNETQLDEGFVTIGGNLGIIGIKCPNGCSNGVCLEAAPAVNKKASVDLKINESDGPLIVKPGLKPAEFILEWKAVNVDTTSCQASWSSKPFGGVSTTTGQFNGYSTDVSGPTKDTVYSLGCRDLATGIYVIDTVSVKVK